MLKWKENKALNRRVHLRDASTGTLVKGKIRTMIMTRTRSVKCFRETGVDYIVWVSGFWITVVYTRLSRRMS